MVSSLTSGFDDLEDDLKDLITQYSNNLNEQLEQERSKIQSTKDLLKKVLIT